VPIVRETGGLRDTVLSYNEYTDDGNGFSFFNYNAHDMLNTIQRAIHYYHDEKDVWHKLQYRGMTGDYSWTNSAGKYIELYHSLMSAEEPQAEEEPDPAEANPVVVETPAEAVETVEEVKAVEPVVAPKPKKPRAPRKPKAETADAEKKPRKPRAKKVDQAAEAPAAEVAEAPKPKKPRAPRKKKTEEATAE